MSHCGAINCSASKKSNPERTFHCFPSDPDRSKRWLQLTRRADLMDKSPPYLSECVKLCSKHFEPSQYAPGSSKRLRKNAEPTVFDFPCPPKRDAVKRRRSVRAQAGGQKRAPAKQGTEMPVAMRYRKVFLEEAFVTEAAPSASNADTAAPKCQPQDRSAAPGESPHPQHSKASKQATKLKQSQNLSAVCCAPKCGASKFLCPYRRFYRFPTDPERCQLWVAACRRPDLLGFSESELNQKFRLCSAHFDRTQMCPLTSKLVEHAVPTLFDVTSPPNQGESDESSLSSRVMVEDTSFGQLKEDSEPLGLSGLLIGSAGRFPYNEVTAAPVRLVEGKENSAAAPVRLVEGKENSAAAPVRLVEGKEKTSAAAAVHLGGGKEKTSAAREGRTPLVPSPVEESSGPKPGGANGTGSPSALKPQHTHGPKPQQEAGSEPEPEPWRSLLLGLPRCALIDYLREAKKGLEKLCQLQVVIATFEEKEDLSPSSDGGQREKGPRNGDPEAISPTRAATPTPLLTLRNSTDWSKPGGEDVNPISADLMRPLKPLEAWRVISRLKLKLLAREAWLLEAQKAVKISELQLKKERAENRILVKGLRRKLNRCRVLLKRVARESQSAGKTKPANDPIANVKRLTRELEGEREKGRGLLRVFTPGQLHTLQTGQKTRFSVEDLRRALEIRRRVSLSAYSYIRSKVGLPMPTAQFLRRAAPKVPALRELYREVLVGNLRKMPFNRKFHLNSEPVHPETMKAQKRVLGIPPRRRNRKNLKKDQPEPVTPVSTMGKPPMVGETGSPKKRGKKRRANHSLVEVTQREEGSGVQRNRRNSLDSSRPEQQAAPADQSDADGAGTDEITQDDYLLKYFSDVSRTEVEDEVEEVTVQSSPAVEVYQEFDSGGPEESALKAVRLLAESPFGPESATKRRPCESRGQSRDLDFGVPDASSPVVSSSLPSGLSADHSTYVRPTRGERLEESRNHLPSSVRVVFLPETTHSSAPQEINTATRVSFVDPAAGADRASALTTCRIRPAPFKKVVVPTSASTKHAAKSTVIASQPRESTVLTSRDAAVRPTVRYITPNPRATPQAYKVSPKPVARPELFTEN